MKETTDQGPQDDHQGGPQEFAEETARLTLSLIRGAYDDAAQSIIRLGVLYGEALAAPAR